MNKDKVKVLDRKGYGYSGIDYSEYIFTLSCGDTFYWDMRVPPTYCPWCGKEIENGYLCN